MDSCSRSRSKKVVRLSYLWVHPLLAIVISAFVGWYQDRDMGETLEYEAAYSQSSVEQPIVQLIRESTHLDFTAELTNTEIRNRLKDQIENARPTHRLTLKTGKILEGQLVHETSNAIQLREAFGYSGHIIASYKRSEILTFEELPQESIQVSSSDLELYSEFPDFHFVKLPPYTIVTDDSYDEVEKVHRLLRELRNEFTLEFVDLFNGKQKPDDIKILFFGKEAPFRTYARQIAPELINSSGFYSAGNKRLVLLNQLGTRQFAELHDKYSDNHADHLHAGFLLNRQTAALQSELISEAKTMTERLIRHEGAHQLFHSYGIHSPYRPEPTWLIEGLAVYCEPAGIGRYHSAIAERFAQLREDRSPIPLESLVNHRSSRGFLAFGRERTELAYAQSWALVYFLMQDEYREKFYRYIRHYSNVSNEITAAAVRERNAAELLVSYLDKDFNSLELDWEKFLARL